MNDRIKVSLTELKKAIGWIEANTQDVNVLFVLDGHKLFISTADKGQQEVDITLYSTDAHMLPKIRKTEKL